MIEGLPVEIPGCPRDLRDAMLNVLVAGSVERPGGGQIERYLPALLGVLGKLAGDPEHVLASSRTETSLTGLPMS